MGKLRVIQWNTGKVGKHSTRAIIDDPRLKLVGMFAQRHLRVSRFQHRLQHLLNLGCTLLAHRLLLLLQRHHQLAQFLGQAATVSARTGTDGVVRFDATGRADAAALRAALRDSVLKLSPRHLLGSPVMAVVFAGTLLSVLQAYVFALLTSVYINDAENLH